MSLTKDLYRSDSALQIKKQVPLVLQPVALVFLSDVRNTKVNIHNEPPFVNYSTCFTLGSKKVLNVSGSI